MNECEVELSTRLRFFAKSALFSTEHAVHCMKAYCTLVDDDDSDMLHYIRTLEKCSRFLTERKDA